MRNDRCTHTHNMWKNTLFKTRRTYRSYDEKKMNLFFIKKQATAIHANPLVIKTPLGKVHFFCRFSEHSLSNLEPQKVELLNPEMILSSWSLDECHVEFLQLCFTPILPPGMEVNKCIGAVWRIKALSQNIAFELESSLESNLLGVPESGEGLIAQSFENSPFKLSIGTEDEELLISRAGRYWLPTHFKNEIKPEFIQYLPKGIQINLRGLEPNETVQVHFIVAWSSLKNQSISTWYAVDQSSEKFLHQADVG